MKLVNEKLVQPDAGDGYETYEVTYLERRMTEKHWKQVQDTLEDLAESALKEQRGWYKAR